MYSMRYRTLKIMLVQIPIPPLHHYGVSGRGFVSAVNLYDMVGLFWQEACSMASFLVRILKKEFAWAHGFTRLLKDEKLFGSGKE